MVFVISMSSARHVRQRMQADAGKQVIGMRQRPWTVPMIQSMFDNLSFFFQSRQNPASRHLGADHTAKVALEHSGALHRVECVTVTKLIHSACTANSFPKFAEYSSSVSHRPVNRFRLVNQVYAEFLWSSHCRKQVHIGV